MDETVREGVLETHTAVLERTLECGRQVAADWHGQWVTAGSALRTSLKDRCADEDLPADLVALLDTGAGTLDRSIDGSPVPAPPYFTYSSRGPVCRATLSDGRRLVFEVRLFELARRPTRYRFTDPTVEQALHVRIR